MGQNSYGLQSLIPGLVGDLADNAERDVISLINDAPRTPQVATCVVDTEANDTEYALTINGVELTFTSDGSGTKAEIAAGIAAAINDDPLVNGLVSAASDGVDTVTVTARIGGLGFTISDSDANLTTTTTTANDTSDPVGFGCLVARVDSDPEKGALCIGTSFDAKEVEITPTLPSVVAKIVTLAPTAVNDAVYVVEVVIDGVGYKAHYTADGSATAQEIVEGLATKLNDILPASTVAVTEDNTTLTFTAEVAGKSFTVGYGDSSATIDWTYSDTTAASRTAVPQLYFVDVTVGGVTYRGQFLSDSTATVAEITAALVTDLNAQLPANTVLAADGSTVLTLTAEIAGLDFAVGVSRYLEITDTSGDVLNDVIVGVTMRSLNVETTSGSNGQYPANSVMSVLRSGRIWVSTENSAAPSSPVYWRMSGSGAGTVFRSSPASGCIQLDRSRFRWVKAASSTLAVLQIN